jgi:hypothetical protein
MFLSFTTGKNLVRAGYRLRPSEWGLLIQAAACFPAVGLALRLLPLRRLLVLAQWGARPDATLKVTPERVSRLVEIASRFYPFAVTCLNRSLVLYTLLSRRGLRVHLLLGAAKENGEFKAHAWIEHEGALVSKGAVTEQYRPLCSLNHALGLRH